MTRRREFKVDGERLRALRLKRDMTAQQVAEQVGISRPFLCLLETGQRHTVTLPTAVRLASALGVPTEEVAA